MVAVVRGTAYVPGANVSNTDIFLHPRTTIGTLNPAQIVSLPEGISERVLTPKVQVTRCRL